MSHALQCDRCKHFFSPYIFKGDFATVKEIMYQNVNQYAHHEYGYFDEELHFCPECTKKLSLFLSGTELVEKKLLDDLQEDFDATMEEKEDEETAGDTDGDSFVDDFRAWLNAAHAALISICRRNDATPDRDGETPERESDTK